MKYAIVGFGAVGKALARMFARKNIEVAVASTRPADAIASEAKAIGAKVLPRSLTEAIEADIVLLAVPFAAHQDVAKAKTSWKGKTILDVTNAYGVELGDRPSSAVIAEAFTGATLAKVFNHLPAGILAKDPAVNGGRRVVFVASDGDRAAATAETLAKELGFAPVKLGKLAEGGALVQARGSSWAPLIFQDLVKFD